jgi:hypothetical protein
MKVKSVYDNGGVTIDRYTIVFDEVSTSSNLFTCLGLSAMPSHPTYGFSQFSLADDGNHLGKKIDIVDLPGNVRDHYNERMK